MAPTERENLPPAEDLPDEELEEAHGGSPFSQLNRTRRITLQTDTGEIL